MAAPESKKGITEEQQQELDEVFARARKALAIIETYDQARVDRLCQAVAWAVANKQTFTRLVDMGIEESGLGDAVSRMGKRMKIRGVLRDALRQKSVGIIEELPEKGIVKYGKPAGIIACIVPTTNPDLTPAGNAIYAIKARDVVIFSPHPRSKKTSFETVRLMREALEREGAPADILQCLTKVNIPMSQALMARADLIVATGGQPMVRAAYSSGTPAYGVGAGNSTMIIDETANIEEAARNTRLSKTSDFGSGCSADGNLIIEASIFDKLLAQLQTEGGYLASPQEKELLRKAMWDDERHRTVETVAIAPQQLAKAAGFTIPADRKFIIVHGDGIGREHHFSGEKLTTLLAVYKYKGFDQALDMMRAVYEVGGKGHSCGIYSFDQDHIHRLAMAAPGVADHGPAAAVEGQRRRVQQRDADDVEPGLRHVGRQHHLRERPPQALPQHDVGVGADQGGQAVRRGAVRRVLRPGARSRGSRRSRPDRGASSPNSTPHAPPCRPRHPRNCSPTACAWWDTSIIDIHPGKIAIRGYPIEELIGNVRFPDMIWLMLRGELPTRAQGDLLEAAMVPGVDHGPHAPSIAIAQMAVSCGLPVNGAMASAINVLDDVHGGAGQQCMELYREIDAAAGPDGDLVAAAEKIIRGRMAAGEKIVPGFGHRFHPIDPRTAPLFALVEKAKAQGAVSGRWAAIGHAVEAALKAIKGRHIPMNIDGITAVIFCELGFEPELGRGLFVLSRSVGILAHAWEQKQKGVRIKGPMPREIPYRYSGPARRALPPEAARGND